MQEQILMPYTDLRNRGTEQEISQSGQQFIEIDNPVRTTGLDTLTNVVNAIDILVSGGVLGGDMPTLGQGLAYFAASLAIGIGGMISGFAQGKAAVSGIALSAKDDSNFSKAMVSVTLVEIYALLSFIVSLLVVITVPSLNI